MASVKQSSHRAPSTGPITVREIDRAHARAAVHLLAQSFVDEPGLSYILGGTAARRRQVLVPFMWAALRSYPEMVVIHGAWQHGRLVGASLLMRPGAWPLGRALELRGVIWALVGSLPMLVAFPRGMRMFPRMAEAQRRHPHDRPHWYVWCIGVHPSFRRKCQPAHRPRVAGGGHAHAPRRT
jgi:ribosomal protein S18 acetylase RimI-like enzyme